MNQKKFMLLMVKTERLFMLDRSELYFNEEFVKMFENWVSGVYPDDHWRIDKRLTEDDWEYKHENTEDDFILWLNVFVFSNCYKDTWGACKVEYVSWKRGLRLYGKHKTV